MSERITPAQLSMMLGEEIEAVVRELGVDVRRQDRRRLYCFAPWNSHHNPKLEVELFPMPGKWNDWIEGRYGDALGLVGCILTGQPDQRTHTARLEGIRWAKERYGVASEGFDREAWSRRTTEARERAKERERVAAAKLKENRGIAHHVWINAEPLRPTKARPGGIVRGCMGARYLEARGIDFEVLAPRPRAVKFSAEERWHGQGEETHIGPALVTAMTLPDGGFGAIHRTWINPDVEGQKADLSPPRKMWPASEGAAMRLWRGAGHLDEAKAIEKGVSGPVVVCEGIEDGLSLAMMAPEMRVHAAGSLPGLLSWVPPGCAERIIVAADNDWNRPQAQALLNRALDRLRDEFKLPLSVTRSPEGKDFNDLLLGK